MDMDEMEISYDSEDEQYNSRDKQKFNFLAKKTSKSKRKFNIDPFVLIEHLLSDCPTCCKLYSINKLPTDIVHFKTFQITQWPTIDLHVVLLLQISYQQ